MIRVFHIITHFDQGGAEKVAFNIAKSKNSLYEYHLIEISRGNSNYSSRFINDLKAHEIKYHRSLVRNTKLAVVLFPLWFIFTFIKWSPKIIHTHTEVPDISVFLFSIIFKPLISNVKFIRTIHNTQLWNNWKRIGSTVERFYQRHNSNISISKSTQNSYMQTYKKNTPIIYNGLDTVPNLPIPFIVKDKINILFAGRLEYQKGIKTLIEVIKQLSNEENIVFHVIGEGSLKQYMLSELSKVRNCIYHSKIYNLASYLGSFDYLFMPSKFEGLSLMSIESCFAKTPVIINTCEGLEETMPVSWPLKVNNNDIKSYLKIFHSLKTLDYKNLQELAYKNASLKFSIKTMQQKYEQLYSTCSV